LLQALVAPTVVMQELRRFTIKGDTFAHHGIRSARTSADVDVLLHPDDANVFIAAMGEIGWRPRMGEFVGFPTAIHSVSLVHDNWPIDLDVHHEFPGFLRDPAVVFEELWARRETMVSAHQPVTITDLAGSVLILALHALRDGSAGTRYAGELRGLIEASREWTDAQRDDIAALAAATGCAQALDTVLPQLGVEVRDDGAAPEDVRRWRDRSTGRSSSLGRWLRGVSETPVRQRPAFIWRGIWPSEAYLRAAAYLAPDDTRVVRSRIRRLTRGAKQIARAAARRLRAR
jgi:hypothetical protein